MKFKVGQVWEDGYGQREVVIDINGDEEYPIETTRGSYTKEGWYIINCPDSRDNLTKLVKNVATLSTFSEEELTQELEKRKQAKKARYSWGVNTITEHSSTQVNLNNLWILHKDNIRHLIKALTNFADDHDL